ncbi:MAG: AMP-binding protein [Gammaproteobacteria bacterium]|nr:AMP-binding protein [Gammaproteobacteria bacterium]
MSTESTASQPMIDYSQCVAEHALPIPEWFNFGGDVVDAYAADPDKVALLWCNECGDERRLTFADIKRASNRIANYLTECGVKRGERVVVMLPRIPEWQIALTACFKVGAVPIPCITMLSERDVNYRMRHSAAVAVITRQADIHKFADSDHLQARLCVGGSAPGWQDWLACEQYGDNFAPLRVGAEDPAIMYYTSGSTGNPKGVLHAARALYVWRTSARYWLTLTPDDVMWCTADTGWSKAGTSILFGPWSQGAAVLFYDGPFDPQRRFELLARYRVNVFCAAATELRQLLTQDVTPYDLAALRLTVSAGESVNPEIVAAWQALTGTPVLDGYGQTETLMTVMNYPGMPVKPGSMGRALPGVTVAVLDEDERIHTRSARGRLVIRAPNPQLLLEYWQDTLLTAEQYVGIDGQRWFVTGDTVEIDADGYVFYFGRDDDVINSSGYRIGPQEVENALIEHPAVRESAVVGLPDEARGQIVAAFVILHEGYVAKPGLVEALQAHVKDLTAPYKYPRRIEFVTGLPKTVSGKIQRNLLRAGTWRA